MKSILSCGLGILAAIALSGCASNGMMAANSYGEATPGIFYTPNYDQYTRSDSYPTISGGGYYSYGGRYMGGGYGSGDRWNH